MLLPYRGMTLRDTGYMFGHQLTGSDTEAATSTRLSRHQALTETPTNNEK